MARLTFRQGIVRHGKTPGQSFFLQQNGTYVDLIVSPDLTIIAFADGDNDYLFTESVTAIQAWGPLLNPMQEYWLYWDLDKVTGIRTRGVSLLSPIYSDTAPVATPPTGTPPVGGTPPPAPGQMWFDTSSNNATSNKMHEWNGVSWVAVLRVFACKYLGNQFLSPVNGVSVENNFTGSQIGVTGNVTSNVGSLVYGSSGKPIVNQDGAFFTTEDVFTTGVPTGASLKVNNILIRAQSVSPIASYQVVIFTDYNKIQLAQPFDFLDKVYGIVEEDIPTSDVGNVVTEGIIFNQLWDFTDTTNNPDMSGLVNDPIYVDTSGNLTTNINNTIPGQVPLGAIVGTQSILFSPGVYGSSGFGVGNDHGSLTGLADDDHPQYFDEARGDVRYYPRTIADLIFAPIVHTHARADIVDFEHQHIEADIQDLDKYTQSQVDALIGAHVSITGDTMTGALILNADPTTALAAATKQYVDSFASGIDAKEAVAVGTTLDLAAAYDANAGTGGTGGFTGVDITALDGTINVDYTLVADNRVLVKNQIDPTQNGLYVVTDATQVAAILERAADHDGTPASEVSPGNYTFISAGAAQAGGGWVVLAGTSTGPDDTIILNTDPMNWSNVSSATAYTADGTTISIDGSNVISAVPASTGGQIDALLWNGQTINSNNNLSSGDVLISDGANGWDVSKLSSIEDNIGTGSVASVRITNDVTDSLRHITSTTAGNFVVNTGTDINTSSTGNTNITSTLAINANAVGNVTLTAGSGNPNKPIIGMVGNAGTPQINFNADVFDFNATSGNTILMQLGSAGGFSTTLSANGVLTGNTQFILPVNNGASGEVLSTDGLGNTSWIAGGGGGGVSNCLTDTNGTSFISVGYDGTTPCTDDGSNNIQIEAGAEEFGNPAGGTVTIVGGQADGFSGSGGNIVLRPGGGEGGAGSADYNGYAGTIKVMAGYGSYGPYSGEGARINLHTAGQLSNNSFVGIKAPYSLAGYGDNFTIILPDTPATVNQTFTVTSAYSGNNTTDVKLVFEDRPYDLSASAYGTLVDADVILRFVTTTRFQLGGVLTHSGIAVTAPSGAAAVFSVRNGATLLGTVTFADGSTTPTFTVFPDYTTSPRAAKDDIITVTCDTASGIGDVSITLSGRVATNF